MDWLRPLTYLHHMDEFILYRDGEQIEPRPWDRVEGVDKEYDLVLRAGQLAIGLRGLEVPEVWARTGPDWKPKPCQLPTPTADEYGGLLWETVYCVHDIFGNPVEYLVTIAEGGLSRYGEVSSIIVDVSGGGISTRTAAVARAGT